MVVLLTAEAEWLHKAGRNLREFYHEAGFYLLYLPMPDFGVLITEDLPANRKKITESSTSPNRPS